MRSIFQMSGCLVPYPMSDYAIYREYGDNILELLVISFKVIIFNFCTTDDPAPILVARDMDDEMEDVDVSVAVRSNPNPVSRFLFSVKKPKQLRA